MCVGVCLCVCGFLSSMSSWYYRDKSTRATVCFNLHYWLFVALLPPHPSPRLTSPSHLPSLRLLPFSSSPFHKIFNSSFYLLLLPCSVLVLRLSCFFPPTHPFQDLAPPPISCQPPFHLLSCLSVFIAVLPPLFFPTSPDPFSPLSSSLHTSATWSSSYFYFLLLFSSPSNLLASLPPLCFSFSSLSSHPGSHLPPPCLSLISIYCVITFSSSKLENM